MSRRLSITSSALCLLLAVWLSPRAVQADSLLMPTTDAAGDTTGAPTFNRPGNVTPIPVKDGFETPYTPTSLSGLNVRYSVVPFNVTTGGTYDLTVLSDFDNFDTFLLLYRDGFDPVSPLTNALLANDNIDASKTYAAFLVGLTPGVNYFAVVTGSQPNDFGEFILRFQGPGRVNLGDQPTATPEPATLALLATGLSGIGAAVRRRRRKAVEAPEPTDAGH